MNGTSCCVISEAFLGRVWLVRPHLRQIFRGHRSAWYCWRCPSRGSSLFFIIARRWRNLSDVSSIDMRSRLCFLYPGIPGCLWMHVEISIDCRECSPPQLEIKDTINEVKYGCFSDDTRGRRDFYVFGCSIYMWAIFCRLANGGVKISIRSYFVPGLHEIILFFAQCIQQL